MKLKGAEPIRAREGWNTVQRIAMHFGRTVVHGLLDERPCAGALAMRLPLTIPMSASRVGCCGVLPFELPYEGEAVHRGWANGDINYSPAGRWLAVFFDDEENSRRYGGQLTIGHIEGSPDQLHGLAGVYDVRIEGIGGQEESRPGEAKE